MLTFTKSMLALSVMAAVGGANAATYTVDTTLTDKIFTEGIVAINRDRCRRRNYRQVVQGNELLD